MISINSVLYVIDVFSECDGNPVTVTDATGTLEPKKVSTGGYAAGTCVWNIEAPEGQVEILLLF